MYQQNWQCFTNIFWLRRVDWCLYSQVLPLNGFSMAPSPTGLVGVAISGNAIQLLCYQHLTRATLHEQVLIPRN
jgi:hypothetical protein